MMSKSLLMSLFCCLFFVSLAYATFNTPVPVSINTNLMVRTPSVTGDQLIIFFGMYQNSPSEIDIYYATRTNKNQSFGSPIPVSSVNSSLMEWGPDISADGLTLYFARGSSFNNGDIWAATHSSIYDSFGAPQIVTELNSNATEAGACLSDDGLSMYLCSSRTGGSGLLDLWYFTRQDINAAFGQGVNLSEINTVGDEISPSITADGLTIYWGLDLHNIWSASRTDINSPFSNPHLVTELNYTGYDSGAPDISSDGKVIFFNSARPGSLPGFLWMATIIPEPSAIIMMISCVIAICLRKAKRK